MKPRGYEASVSNVEDAYMIERTNSQAQKYMRTLPAFAALLFCSLANASPKPTATEAFHLRSECGRLGKQLLVEHGITGTEEAHGFSVVMSRYDEETNRCYVMIKNIFLREHIIQLHLYDGQEGGIIAMWGSEPNAICLIKGQTVLPPIAYEYILQMMNNDVRRK